MSKAMRKTSSLKSRELLHLWSSYAMSWSESKLSRRSEIGLKNVPLQLSVHYRDYRKQGYGYVFGQVCFGDFNGAAVTEAIFHWLRETLLEKMLLKK